MKVLYIIRCKSPISSMALWPFILVNKKYKGSYLPYWHVTKSEVRLRQQAELLVVFFFLWFVVELCVRRFKARSWGQAFDMVSFNQEAIANAHVPYYSSMRGFWNFLKYI